MCKTTAQLADFFEPLEAYEASSEEVLQVTLSSTEKKKQRRKKENNTIWRERTSRSSSRLESS